MNKLALTFLILCLCLFVIFEFFSKKMNVKPILKAYFGNYCGGYYKNKKGIQKRHYSIASIISIGFLPYIIGITLFFSFETFFMNCSLDMLLQINIIILTISCLFFGFDFKPEDDRMKNTIYELYSSLIVNALLIIISSILIFILYSIKEKESIFICIIFAIQFKIFSLLFISLKKIFFLRTIKSIK